MVNKFMLLIHILAYLLIIVIDIVQQLILVKLNDLKTYEIVTICEVVVYFGCTLIFGLIVNTIVTKIVNATHSYSISSSLMNSATGSVAGSLAKDEQSLSFTSD